MLVVGRGRTGAVVLACWKIWLLEEHLEDLNGLRSGCCIDLGPTMSLAGGCLDCGGR